MTKKDTVPGISEAMRQGQTMLASGQMLAPQMEGYWKIQEALLEESEVFVKEWYRRRHEAAQSALDIVRKMNGNGADPTEKMQAMAAWQRESVARVAEDMRQWMDFGARCAGRVAAAESEVVEEGLKQAGKTVTSAAGTKHATPV